jgi:hypothetical protein
VRTVTGPECSFEQLFTRLADNLGVERSRSGFHIGPVQATPQRRLRKGIQTIDDFMASVVGLAVNNGPPVCTGFVVAHPRLIISDGYSANTHFDEDQVTVIASNDHRFASRVVQRDWSHPFAPFMVEVPEGLTVTGLCVDTSPLEPDVPVRGVAAGERVGVSSSRIADPTEQSVNISPVGQVDQLIAVEAVVGPGASGAPVLDRSFSVRGYVVAGRLDSTPSFMYPSQRWAGSLEAKPPSQPRQARRPRRRRV